MSEIIAPQTQVKAVSETEILGFDMRPLMGEGETISSVDGVVDVDGTDELTIGSPSKNGASEVILGQSVPANMAVLVSVAGGDASAGAKTYKLRFKITTSDGRVKWPIARLKVVPDDGS